MTVKAAAAPTQKIVAVFDYDGTLIEGDSLWPFLVAVAGWPRAVVALVGALGGFVFVRLKGGDYRTYVKARLLRQLLGGKRVRDLAPAVARVKKWPRERKHMKALREHSEAGHHIVIASGSLDLYLHALLEDIPHDAVLCTEMEVYDGVLTGRMVSGNCVRARKAERVAAYLAAHGPFEDSYGYGNMPHDLPMLALVRERVIV